MNEDLEQAVTYLVRGIAIVKDKLNLKIEYTPSKDIYTLNGVEITEEEREVLERVFDYYSKW